LSYKIWIVLALVVVVIASPVIYRLFFPGDAPVQEVTPAPLPEDTPEEAPVVVTREIYDSLRYGITYRDAVDLIGGPETESFTEYDEGVDGFTRPTVTVWYRWLNPDRSSMSLGFISQKLAEKKEERLR
jgi:hypothetical protein